MYDVTGKRGVDEFLAVSCGNRRGAQAAAEQAEAEGWREVRVAEQDSELAWRCGVKAAMRELFPADVAAKIEQAEAFGALVYRVRERACAYDHTPAEVLGAVDAEDRAFASRADEPAAFLAAKVRDLPEPDENATGNDETSDDEVPGEVTEVISAVRTFTDAIERVGAEEFAKAAAQLRTTEMAWVLDRLDDVRQSVTEVLEHLADEVEPFGADLGTWNETLADLNNAGEGLYTAIQEIDPETCRHDIVHL